MTKQEEIKRKIIELIHNNIGPIAVLVVGLSFLCLLIFWLIFLMSPKSIADCEKLNKIPYKGVCIYEHEISGNILKYCLDDLSKYNNSMSNTWGNDEYDTKAVTDFGIQYIDKCVEANTKNK